ncbi:MAG: hypothetical protein ACREDR_30335 [Blastocatellia bacterium]
MPGYKFGLSLRHHPTVPQGEGEEFGSWLLCFPFWVMLQQDQSLKVTGKVWIVMLDFVPLLGVRLFSFRKSGSKDLV